MNLQQIHLRLKPPLAQNKHLIHHPLPKSFHPSYMSELLPVRTQLSDVTNTRKAILHGYFSSLEAVFVITHKKTYNIILTALYTAEQ